MNKLRILVADDDVAIVKFIQVNLKVRGYDVIVTGDGKRAVEAVESNQVDLIILDIMMPGMDGMEVCRRIREWSQVPIIMLSASGEEDNKVKCLEMGADDYLTKPFNLAELLARIQTALRHHDAAKAVPVATNTRLGEMEIDFSRRSVSVKGHRLELTPTEYSLLQQLVLNKDKVLTHSMLLQKVWGNDYYSEKEYIRVFIRRLRKKIESDPEKPHYIITVPGVGYYMNSAS
jgi:two-component system, OmpR family, KDP operon response regulator KdpE